jgi:hypothetical protein
MMTKDEKWWALFWVYVGLGLLSLLLILASGDVFARTLGGFFVVYFCARFGLMFKEM